MLARWLRSRPISASRPSRVAPSVISARAIRDRDGSVDVALAGATSVARQMKIRAVRVRGVMSVERLRQVYRVVGKRVGSAESGREYTNFSHLIKHWQGLRPLAGAVRFPLKKPVKVRLHHGRASALSTLCFQLNSIPFNNNCLRHIVKAEPVLLFRLFSVRSSPVLVGANQIARRQAEKINLRRRVAGPSGPPSCRRARCTRQGRTAASRARPQTCRRPPGGSKPGRPRTRATVAQAVACA